VLIPRLFFPWNRHRVILTRLWFRLGSARSSSQS
jgi:hypothetical protein